MSCIVAKKPELEESTEELISVVRKWQGIEDMSIAACAELEEKTKNPLMREILESFRQDSLLKREVQQIMITCLRREICGPSPTELGRIWECLEMHAEFEQKTMALAEKARRCCRLSILRHLFSSLMEHDKGLTDY